MDVHLKTWLSAILAVLMIACSTPNTPVTTKPTGGTTPSAAQPTSKASAVPNSPATSIPPASYNKPTNDLSPLKYPELIELEKQLQAKEGGLRPNTDPDVQKLVGVYESNKKVVMVVRQLEGIPGGVAVVENTSAQPRGLRLTTSGELRELTPYYQFTPLRWNYEKKTDGTETITNMINFGNIPVYIKKEGSPSPISPSTWDNVLDYEKLGYKNQLAKP